MVRKAIASLLMCLIISNHTVVVNLNYDSCVPNEVQTYIKTVCYPHDIEPALVIAMIEAESSGVYDAQNGNCIGLMQIDERWHRERMERLGCTDLTNPYMNVTVGVDILAEKLRDYGTIEAALMAYNGGNSYANRMLAEGKTSSYAQKIIARTVELRSNYNDRYLELTEECKS